MGAICRAAALALLATFLIALPGCGKREDAPVVAKVGDKVLTVDDLYEMVPSGADLEHVMSVVDDWVDDQLLYKEAVRRGIDKEEAVRRLIENSKMDIVINELLEREIKAAGRITEEMIKKYYEDHKESFIRDKLEIRARQILVDSKSKAWRLRSRIISGEDFGKIAREESLDISSQNGGDLGYFSEDMVDEGFWRAVINMKPNVISTPIRTGLGYHIIEVLDRKQAGTLKELGEVRDEIVAEIYAERQREVASKLLEKLRSENVLEVNKRLIERNYGR